MILSIQRRAGQGKGQTPAHCSLPKRPQSTSRTVQASVSRAFQASGTAAPEFVQQLKREVREGGPFKTFSLLTAYLHCVQLAAFLSQVHFPECTTANGLHYGTPQWRVVLVPGSYSRTPLSPHLLHSPHLPRRTPLLHSSPCSSNSRQLDSKGFAYAGRLP